MKAVRKWNVAIAALGVVALGIVISGALVARGARRAAPVAKSVVA